MPAKEELDGDAADEGSVQHGDSDRCRGSGAEEAEEVAELPKQFAQTKIMKPQSWTTSLSMTASLPTLVLGDADDGKSPGAAAAAAVPAQQLQAEDLIHRRNALDAHESRMLKAFGKAYIKRTKSDSEVASENAIARIMALRASITEQNERSNKTLNSCQSLMDACGDAIAAWFKGLSGAALKRAIKEAFDKFDEDGSGLMGRDEFAKAMHTLGLRLTAAEYDILFDEYDEDKSGEIDLDEFTHMVKKYLKLSDDAFSDDSANCTRKNWADDESLHGPAAANIQRIVRSSLAREEVFEGLTGNRTFEELRKRNMYRQNWDEDQAISHTKRMVGDDDRAFLVNTEKGIQSAEENGDDSLSASRNSWADDERLFGRAASDLQRNARSSAAREEVFAGFSGKRTFAELAKRDLYRQNWADDETLLNPAAAGIQSIVRSSIARTSRIDHSGRDLEDFARLSSAPYGASHPPMLSDDENQRARRFMDDSGVGLFTRLRPRTSESEEYRTGARADIWEKLRRQREREGPRSKPRVGPNRNLNHDADVLLSRAMMRVFFSNLPTEKEIYDHDFFQRCRSEPPQKRALSGTIDPWPGQLPPLKQDAFISRESLRESVNIHAAFPRDSTARGDEEIKNLPPPSSLKHNKRDLRLSLSSAFHACESGEVESYFPRSASLDRHVYKSRPATQGHRSHPQDFGEGQESSSAVPSRVMGGGSSVHVHGTSRKAILVTSIRDDIAHAQHEYALLSSAQRRPPTGLKSASSSQNTLPELRASRQGKGHAHFISTTPKNAEQERVKFSKGFRLTNDCEILDLRG